MERIQIKASAKQARGGFLRPVGPSRGLGQQSGAINGGIGKRYGIQTHKSVPRGFSGLGADEAAPENLLTTGNPVGMYIRAIQSLISSLPEYHTTDGTPPSKTIVSSGIWDYATHQGMTDWVGSIDEPGDMKDMPLWGQAPAFTAKFAVDLVLLAMKSDVGVRIGRVLLETLGAPTTGPGDVLLFFKGEGNGSPTWIRSMRIFDAIERYIIGCEGGRAYGDPMTKYKGYGSAAAAFGVPLLLVALL
jgi:hypothetical protein